MVKRIILALAVIGSLFVGVPAQAAVFSEGGSPAVNEEVRDDVFAAGQSVTVGAPVFGELFAAGSTVAVSNRPERSVFAAGNTVTIDKGAGYNAFAAGSTVTLSGEYGHDVFAAGANVIIKEGTVINGDLFVGAGELTLGGTVKGDVNVSAEQVASNAIVGGSLKGEISELTFTGGSIAGDLKYGSEKDASGLDKVTIGGKTERTTPKIDNKDADKLPFFLFPLAIAGWAMGVLSSFILGAFLIWLVSKKVVFVTEAIRSNWTNMFVRGLVAFIVIPAISLIAFLTIAGWPIGVIGFMLYVPLLMIAGSLAVITAGTFITEAINQKDNWWLSLLLGVIVVSILGATPILGWWIKLAVFIGLTLPALGGIVTWYQEKLQAK